MSTAQSINLKKLSLMKNGKKKSRITALCKRVSTEWGFLSLVRGSHEV